MIGFAEMLQLGAAGPLDEKQREYLSCIAESAGHALAVVNDLLDLSRAAAGGLEVGNEIVDLAEQTRSCLRIAVAAKPYAAHTVTTAGLDRPLLVNGDSRLLRQALLNILGNAVKYIPCGGTIHIAAGNDTDGGLCLEVRDNGPGMTANELDRALMPYGRGRAARGQVGSGLGLPLAWGFVAAHGGRLDLESAPGRGTRAVIHLPASRVIAP